MWVQAKRPSPGRSPPGPFSTELSTAPVPLAVSEPPRGPLSIVSVRALRSFETTRMLFCLRLHARVSKTLPGVPSGVSIRKKISSPRQTRSEEHTSELQSLMRISYAVFCLKKKIHHNIKNQHSTLITHCHNEALTHLQPTNTHCHNHQEEKLIR